MIRLMRMEAAGLLEFWWRTLAADPTYCFRKIEKEVDDKKTEDSKKPLTLKALSGAFLVLGVGYSLAIAVFIFELLRGHRAKNRSRIHDSKSPKTKVANKNTTVASIVSQSTVQVACEIVFNQI